MYIAHIKELVVSDPYPMYKTESELIEAVGEAEEFFLDNIVEDQYPSQYFRTIDDVSGDVITLDIADYIGQKTFNLFEQCIFNLTEDEEITYTKAHSFFMACNRKRKR